MDIIRGRGVWKIVSSKLRPSVQEPIAQVSVDFASPKVMGSRRRHIPFRMLFLPSNRSICFLKKRLLQKMGYHLSKCFFCEIRNSHILPAVLRRFSRRFSPSFLAKFYPSRCPFFSGLFLPLLFNDYADDYVFDYADDYVFDYAIYLRFCLRILPILCRFL